MTRANARRDHGGPFTTQPATEWRIPRRPEHCTTERYDCREDVDVLTPSPTATPNEWQRVNDVIGYVTWFVHGKDEANLCTRTEPTPTNTSAVTWKGELCARCMHMLDAADAVLAPTCRMHLRDAVWHACERAEALVEGERRFPTREAVEYLLGVIASPAARARLRVGKPLTGVVTITPTINAFRVHMAQLSAATRDDAIVIGLTQSPRNLDDAEECEPRAKLSVLDRIGPAFLLLSGLDSKITEQTRAALGARVTREQKTKRGAAVWTVAAPREEHVS